MTVLPTLNDNVNFVYLYYFYITIFFTGAYSFQVKFPYRENQALFIITYVSSVQGSSVLASALSTRELSYSLSGN